MAKILVVDDERSIRVTTSELLHDAGHDVMTADRAAAALSEVAKTKFDIVLCDIVLPDMSGVTLLGEILRLTPSALVIMMTGGPSVDTATAALREGAFDYLLKPIALDTLHGSINRAIRVKVLTEETRRLSEENIRYQKGLEALVEKRTGELREKERLLAHLSRRERELVRRDLHDGVCQYLVGIGFLAVRMREQLGPSNPELFDMANNIYRLSNETVDLARQIAEGLAPLEDRPQALASALQELATDVVTIYGISCRATCVGSPLPAAPDVALQLYLIAREAMINACKHSKASEISVDLSCSDSGLVLRIRDDGVGIPQSDCTDEADRRRTGMGLDIMRDRAIMIGATVRVDPNPTGGTCVTCHWQNHTDYDGGDRGE